MKPQLSIIIVNYNTRHLLEACLESIRRSISVDYEVIVADNASTDDSFARCARFQADRRFRLLPMEGNLGFAKANNIAAEAANGNVLHFINPDTEVDAALDADYRKVLAAPYAVYVNPLFNPDGSRENDCMPIPSLKNLLLWDFHRKKARYWFKGASVIISMENFRRIGRWSEDYFMYAEDLDLFYQMWMHDLPIRMLDAHILHHGGGSSRNTWNSLEREVVVQKSNRTFYRKYFTHAEYVAVKLYFILHKLFRHPSQVPLEIKAWIICSRSQSSC